MNGSGLRALPAGARAGLTALILVMGGGMVTAMLHLVAHHENRDEQPGVSVDDLVGAYHGVSVRAPLLTALDRQHPDGFAPADRDVLLKWLNGKKVSEGYDDPDQGTKTPGEIIAKSCVSCHGRRSTDPSHVGERIPLEFWEDVKKVAFSRQIDAVPAKILVSSAHTHALALAPLTVVMLALLWFTRWPARLRSALALLGGVGLLLDFASWWLTRLNASFVFLLIGAGGTWAAVIGLAGALVVLDLWLPRGSGAGVRP